MPPSKEFIAMQQQGYVRLAPVLTKGELEFFQDLFEHDREQRSTFWFDYGRHKYSHHQTVNFDSLISSPEIDRLIRHDKIISVVDDLMLAQPCFSEVGLRYMPGYSGPTRHWIWHRDGKHLVDHPLRTRNLMLMVYLTDVDEKTHCLSVSPESSVAPILLDAKEQLARGGIHQLMGPAGSAFILNYSLLHSLTIRQTSKERKSIQIYYGRADEPAMANDSVIPPSFWRDCPDVATRKFYGVLNAKSRKYLELSAGGPKSLKESATILREIDYQHR